MRIAPLTVVFVFFFLSLSYSQKKQSNKEKQSSEYFKWYQDRLSVDFPYEAGMVIFEQIDTVNVIGKSKEDLVTFFKSALSDILNQAKSAIDIDDRDGGLVIAKVHDSYAFTYKKKVGFRPLKYTIKFQSKDNKFRIQITNVEIGLESTFFNGYTIDTQTRYVSFEDREKFVSSFENYKTLGTDAKARSIVILSSLKEHLNRNIRGLVNLTVQKAKDDF